MLEACAHAQLPWIASAFSSLAFLYGVSGAKNFYFRKIHTNVKIPMVPPKQERRKYLVRI